MLPKRTALLTLTGLLTSYLATAQTAAAGPGPTDILSWLAWALAVVVLVMGLMTAISLAAAASQQGEAEAPAALETPAPAATVAATLAPVALLTPEEVVAA